jgi:hypothetical protein
LPIQRLNNCGRSWWKHELSEQLSLPTLSKSACGDMLDGLGIYLANVSSHRNRILQGL